MNPEKPPPPEDANEEIAALIETLHQTGQRLEELTAGEVDTVADLDGRTFMLRRAQEQLRHSEAVKQAAILNALPAHIALLDTQGRIISVNEAWRRFGSPNVLHSPGYGIGLNYVEICDSARGDDASEAHQVAEGIRSVLDGGVKSFSIEYPSHSPMEQRWFLLTVTPLNGDHPNGAVVMHLNITERKRAEEELRTKELRYAAVITSAPNAFVTSDAAGRIVGWNPSAERIFGYAEAEVIGQPLTLLIPQRLQDRHLDGMKRVQSGGERRAIGKTVELVGRRKDASEFPLELSLAEWTVEKGQFFTGIIHDITERKRANDALRAAEEQFRGLVEQSIAGIYIIQDDKLAYVNPRFAEIRGFGSAEELIGRDPMPLIAEKDRGIVAENRRRQLSGEVHSMSYNFTALCKDGSTVEVGVSSTCATYRGRSAIIGMMQDISEKKRAEERIQRYVAQIENALMSTVRVVTTLGEMRDPYTAGHQRRVAEIAVAIGTELGFDARRQEGLRVAGLLHDVGKIKIPAEFLTKPGKLSTIEFRVIQGHPQASYDVLKDVEFPWPVAQVALQHHERIDGSGYPKGLKGEAILLEARIMAVADVVEAMSSHRPYRAGLGIEAALSEIEHGRGSVYDPAVADACLMLFREKGYAIPE